MTGTNDKSDTPLHQTKINTNNESDELSKKLYDLGEELHQLKCCYQFYHEAIQAVTAKNEPATFTVQWQYGLYLIGEWLQEGCQGLIERLDGVRKNVSSIKT